MNIAIVGAEAAKFTPESEGAARDVIRMLLADADAEVMVSGGCHLGGVDIWAEEIARNLDVRTIVHLPAIHEWAGGYRERNMLIARDADVVHVIVVKGYPPGYTGMRFPLCYHCQATDHVKSGACWTAKQAAKLGKPAHWHIIDQTKEVPACAPSSAS